LIELATDFAGHFVLGLAGVAPQKVSPYVRLSPARP
jgi:hypothetical protein